MSINLRITKASDPTSIIEEREMSAGEAFLEALSRITDLPDPTCRILSIAIGTADSTHLSYEFDERVYTFTAEPEDRSMFCSLVLRPACEYAELHADHHGPDVMLIARGLKAICRSFAPLEFGNLVEVGGPG